MFLFGFVFLQYFSTVPLYYKEGRSLSELEIGALIGFNGLLVFLIEMPLIKKLEESKYSKEILILFGFLLVGLSFVVLNFTSWIGVLVFGIILMSFGEMIVFPFSNAVVIERSKNGKQGEYMSYYSIAFSVSHIFSHNAGMQLIDNFGYNITWTIVTIITLVGLSFVLLLIKMVKKEKLINLINK